MASGFADKLRLVVSQGNDRLRAKEDAEERACLAQLGFPTRNEAREAFARFIYGFYDPTQHHAALDLVSPVQFERQVASQTALH